MKQIVLLPEVWEEQKHPGLFHDLYCSTFPWVSEVNALLLLLSRANTLINFNHAKFTFSNRLKSSQKLEPRAVCCPQSLSDTSLRVLCDNPLSPTAVLWGVDHSHCRLPNEETADRVHSSFSETTESVCNLE